MKKKLSIRKDEKNRMSYGEKRKGWGWEEHGQQGQGFREDTEETK